VVDAGKVGMAADPVALLRNYRPGNTSLVMGARVTGEAKTAFPDGPPKNEPDKDKSKDDANAASAEKPDEAKTKSQEQTSSQLKSGKVNAIVIADTDLMADQFWVDRRQLLGQEMVMPTAHNAALVLGALENLSGNDALIALRARGVSDRPFTLVEDLRRNAERKFREKEQALTQKLKDLQTKLTNLETTQGGAVLLSEEERDAADKFRAEMLTTRRQLRDVKLALRRDIDRLDGWLKFANIGLVPLAIGFAGIGWSVWRARRRKTTRP